MEKIQVELRITEGANETYPFMGSLLVGIPKEVADKNRSLPSILLNSGFFRSPQAAKDWGNAFVDILNEHHEWMRFKSVVELDQWVLAMTPPDDFERDPAQ